jgi:hypothetical protein
MAEHPMYPTDEQLARWESDWFSERENADVLLIQAFQAGADAELDACQQWLIEQDQPGFACHLLLDRRPKPPSLKQKALTDLSEIGSHYIGPGAAKLIDTIRRALEALPDD